MGRAFPRGLPFLPSGISETDPSFVGCFMSPLCGDARDVCGSIYHLRTEEQYRRGLPHESTVQGTYMFLARWNGTLNKYLPLRDIGSLIQASFLHFDDVSTKKRDSLVHKGIP